MRNKDSDYFELSEPGTLPNLLFYNKTNPNDPCILFTEKGLNQKLSNFFLIGIQLHMPVLRTLNAIYNLNIFYSPQPFYSLNSVLYMRKKVSKSIRNELDKWSSIYIERGYSLKVRFCFSN